MKLHGCNPAFLGYANNPEEPRPTGKQLREEYISIRFDEIWEDHALLRAALDDHGLFSEACAAVLEAATRDVDRGRS